MISVEKLTFTYPHQEAALFEDLSLTIPDHQWVAIVGRNGSGKSTLARLIAGLLPTPAGTITVNGLPVDEDHLAALHQQLGFVFQNPDNQFVGATVADDVAFGLENRRVAPQKMPTIIERALAQVRMTPFKAARPEELSGGQKQRVALAGALALKPAVLILDEATSMLDPQGRGEVLSQLASLRQQGELTIISITHDPAEVALADQVIVLDQGQVRRQDSPERVLTDAALVEAVGLVQPFALRLKAALQAQGVAVPATITTEGELVQWLNQQLNTRG